MDLWIDKGISAVDLIQVLGSLLPFFLLYSLPLALLVGVLVAFGRLSADGEILALRSSGVGLGTMATPALIIAGGTAVLLAALALWVSPACNATFRDRLFRIAVTGVSNGIQPGRFFHDFPGMVLYAQKIDRENGQMGHILVADDRPGLTRSIILAETGRLMVDSDSMSLGLHLERGTVYPNPPQENGRDDRIIEFDRYEVVLPLGPAPAGLNRPLKPKEVPTGKLLEFAGNLGQRSERRYLAELHRRLSLPLAPLLLTMVGIPLGLRRKGSGRSGGFVIALAVFVAYYLGLSLAETLTVEAGLPCTITFWPFQVAFAVVGVFLLRDPQPGVFSFRRNLLPIIFSRTETRQAGRNSRP